MTRPSLDERIGTAPTGLLVIFSPGSWAWIIAAFRALYEAQNAQAERLDAVLMALGPLTAAVEGLALATDDLKSAVGRQEASTTAALEAIETEMQQVRDALAEISGQPELVARLNANADRIDAAVAALQSDDPAPPTP